MKNKIIVFCTRLTQGFKLTCCINQKPSDPDKKITSEDREGIEDSLIKSIGYWVGKCSSHHMLITDVEVIFHPVAQQLALSINLKQFFAENNLNFSITIGVQISEEDSGMQYALEEDLEMLSRRNAGLN